MVYLSNVFLDFKEPGAYDLIRRWQIEERKISVVPQDEDVSALLIEKGADVNQAMNDGAAPLHVASRNGHKDAAARRFWTGVWHPRSRRLRKFHSL